MREFLRRELRRTALLLRVYYDATYRLCDTELARVVGRKPISSGISNEDVIIRELDFTFGESIEEQQLARIAYERIVTFSTIPGVYAKLMRGVKSHGQ